MTVKVTTAIRQYEPPPTGMERALDLMRADDQARIHELETLIRDYGTFLIRVYSHLPTPYEWGAKALGQRTADILETAE